jgi:Uncharacterized protein conserved in bacteria
MMNRRNLLRGLAALPAAGACASAIAPALGGMAAHAADTGGYKALVCVFLHGGLDNYDTVIPYDPTSYDRLRSIRGGLFNGYGGSAPRDRSRLLPLEPVNAGAFGGRQFALPSEMSGLHRMFQDGDAAIVGNVGPLIRPMNRTSYDNDSVPKPKHLFSHNDQMSTWMSSAPEGAQFGWGGRIADYAIESGANANEAFSVVTPLGNELFLTGQSARPYQVGINKATSVDLLDEYRANRGSPERDALYEKLKH